MQLMLTLFNNESQQGSSELLGKEGGKKMAIVRLTIAQMISMHTRIRCKAEIFHL